MGRLLALAVIFFLATSASFAQGPAAYSVLGASRKLPNGGRPVIKVPFPEIRDWKNLRIKLQRSVCFGACPAYSVEIDGDGNVSYQGQNYVAVTGAQHAEVSAEAVRDLYAQFKKADFFWLLDSYRAGITDIPAYAVSISFDGHSKQVIDYAGPMIGMPKEVSDLENQIDAVAGTKKWISGTAKTPP